MNTQNGHMQNGHMQNGHTQNGASLATATSLPAAATDSLVEKGLSPLVAAGRSWVQKELNFYDNGGGSSSSYNPRKTGKGNSVKVVHLELAAAEFSRRFSPISLEQDMEQEEDEQQRAPVLLVSTHVKPDWTPPVGFTTKSVFGNVRFLSVPNADGKTSSLFISCMPGNTHGEADAHVADMVRDWVHGNQLGNCFYKNHSGGRSYQPDISLRPATGDPTPPGGAADSDPNHDNKPYRRLVVEVEFCNRNAERIRTAGRAVFDNPFSALFLGIKIWNKTQNGFAAVAILWEKNPVTQNIALLNAVDFGTRTTDQGVQGRFNAPAAGPNLLPGVPPAAWTRAALPPGYAPPAFGDPPLPPAGSPARLTLPHTHLLHRVTYAGAPPQNPYVLGPPLAAPQPIDDLHLDLHHYAYKLDNGSWPP